MEARWSSGGGNERQSSPALSQMSLRRNTFDASSYPYGHRPSQYPDDIPRNRLPFEVSYRRHSHMGSHPSRPGEISTAVTSGLNSDDEQTPVARYGSVGPNNYPSITQKVSEDKPNSSNISKYECSYCGKGFNRPSSLKVNSLLSLAKRH
jgi:hypothetical protein